MKENPSVGCHPQSPSGQCVSVQPAGALIQHSTDSIVTLYHALAQGWEEELAHHNLSHHAA